MQCAGLGESCVLLPMLGFSLETVRHPQAASPVIHGALFIVHPEAGSAGSDPFLCIVDGINDKGFRACLYESRAWAEVNGKQLAYQLCLLSVCMCVLVSAHMSVYVYA